MSEPTEKPEYQVLARKYRPQVFADVVGQEAIVTTLKNAISMKRLANAYLFCGSRGTGKTTLARLFAKALNCQAKTADGEPCNACSSCKEISAGCSLDMLEIDGASHRGIDDIRQINDNVGYTSSGGAYKIYLIDEVHMLTKEAFNALLKTLEEPPERVKFLFATTEPHKVLPTILSRCQRFNLNRIPLNQIVSKLAAISKDSGIECEEEALRLIAKRADGGLRDAESLLDQIFAFHESKVTAASVAAILGSTSKELFFEIDRAAKEGNLAKAFEISHRIFSEGKDIGQFLHALCEHFRQLFVIKLCGKDSTFLDLTEQECDQYAAASTLYSDEQYQYLIDLILKAEEQLRFQHSGLIALEHTLLQVIGIHQRVFAGALIKQLKAAQGMPETPLQAAKPLPLAQPQQTTPLQQAATPAPPSPPPQQVADPIPPPPRQVATPVPPAIPQPEPIKGIIQEDPTPSKQDLGIREKKAETPRPVSTPTQASPPPTPSTHLVALSDLDKRRLDTILQFTAVELEGRIQR